VRTEVEYALLQEEKRNLAQRVAILAQQNELLREQVRGLKHKLLRAEVAGLILKRMMREGASE